MRNRSSRRGGLTMIHKKCTVVLHEHHQDRPTQARNASKKLSRLSITMTPLTRKSKKAKCMPCDTTVAHTRQPSTQAMCHSRLSTQLNTFLKHEEKRSHIGSLANTQSWREAKPTAMRKRKQGPAQHPVERPPPRSPDALAGAKPRKLHIPAATSEHLY